jgi:hypothetical protein
MPIPFLPAIYGAIFGGLSGLGRSVGQNPYRWWEDYVRSGRDRAWLEAERARQAGFSIFDPLREALLGDFDLTQGYTRDMFARYLQDAFGTGILSPVSARDRILESLGYRPEGFNDALAILRNSVHGLQGPTDIASQIFATGGWSPESQELLDFYRREMLGQGAANSSLADVGLDILGQRGQDQYSRGWLDIGTRAAETGGMVPELSAGVRSALGLIGSQGWGPRESRLYDAGASLLESGGMTPEVSGLYSMARELAGSRGISPEIARSLGDIDRIVQAGGYSPENRDLYEQAKDILSRRESQVMSPQEAAEKARAAAHLEQARRMEDVMRRAQARGGGAVVSGLQGRALAEFEDEMARAADEAALRALLSQQGLVGDLARTGLTGALSANEDATRRLLTALGISPDILRVASQREGLGYSSMSDALQRALGYAGIGSSSMSDAGRLAVSREGLGYSSLPSMYNAGTARMEPLLRLAQAGAQNELARMQLGGSLLEQFNRARLAAGSGLGSLLGNQQQYTINAGNLLGNLLQQQSAGGRYLGDLALAGGQFGIGLGRSLNADIWQYNPYQLGSDWLNKWHSGSQAGLINLYNPMIQSAYGLYESSTRPHVPGSVGPRPSPWSILSGAASGAASRLGYGTKDLG